MNRLNLQEHARIIGCLVEGNSNFGRIHQTLRVTPAMEAGLTGHVWSLEEIAALADDPAGSKLAPSMLQAVHAG